VPPHGSGRAGDLIRRFPFRSQGGKQEGDFIFRHLAGEKQLEDLLHLLLRQILPAGESAEVTGDQIKLRCSAGTKPNFER
jgi:hypothetical protein